MFKNKIVVRADPPSPSPFLLLQLHPPPSSSPPPPPTLELEILCWKLSRKWRIACFAQPSAFFVIYQKVQREAADRAVSELVGAIPDVIVDSEEQLNSPALIAKAVEIVLRCILLDHKWTCVGDNSFIYSALTSADERNPLCALNVCVLPDAEIGFVFLISPEVLCFSRYKISDLLPPKDIERLSFDEQMQVSDCDFPKPCNLIPYLLEGHVIGVSKQLPTNENFEKLEELWKIKHGVPLYNEYFISVQVSLGSQIDRQWFSSAYVLRGSGFTAAPRSIRLLKALHAIESFIKILGVLWELLSCYFLFEIEWDFFSQGVLKITEISPFGTDLKVDDWEKAANISIRRNNIAPSAQASSTEANFNFKDLQIALDFRTPKPATHGSQVLKDFRNQQKPIFVSKICTAKTVECMSLGNHTRSTIKYAPSFRKFSLGTSGGIGKKISKEVGLLVDNISSTGNDENTCTCINTDTNLSRSSLPTIEGSAPNTQAGINDGHHTNEKISSIGTSEKKRSKFPKKEKDKMLPGNKISEKPETVPLGKKISATKERKKEDIAEGVTKMKAQPCPEQSDMSIKVMNFHKRGQLQSLTIADLKCFLSSKKAKVGGKKEELVQRVIGLLP